MIDLLENLTERQRVFVRHHEGVAKARRIASRYRRLVDELTRPQVASPLAGLMPINGLVPSNCESMRPQANAGP